MDSPNKPNNAFQGVPQKAPPPTPPASPQPAQPTSPPSATNTTNTPPAAAADAPPQENKIPLQKPSEINVGVGTPNIGVEEKPLENPIGPDPMAAPAGPSPADVMKEEPTMPEPPPPPNKPVEPTSTSVPIKSSAAPQDEESKIDMAEYANGGSAQNPPPTSQVQPLQTNVQVKNYQQPKQTTTFPQPPVKAAGSKSLVTLAIIALLGGGLLGFLGFRYWDKIKTFASSSNTQTSPAPQETPTLDVNFWKTYGSDLFKFSLKYPNGWYASTTDPKAEALVFAGDQASLEGEPTAYKIEINFQNANGQTLKNWVEANAAAMGENKKAKEITVSGQTAFQQILEKTGPKIATYIERPDKIMIVTYTAPAASFGDGGEWYNNLINSIKLT